MTRRMFVKTASAFAGGAVFGMDFSAKADMKLAFQVYGVRDLCERDFAGTLKTVRAIGYTGVETGRFYGLDAKGLGAVVRGAGLELVALQLYPHNLTEPQLGETIRFCKECGCRRINVAWYKGSKENPNDWQLLVNVLNHAAEVCAKEGITVYIDGRRHGPKAGRGKGEAVSETEEFILLTTEAKWYRNNRMTGKGVPELESALGDEFIVDYVRVYDIVE